MRPQRSQAFQSDAFRKLDQLELIAALLERDVSHHRAWVAELSGLTPARPRRAKRMMPDWARLAVAGISGARAVHRQAVAIVTSKRLHAALRQAYAFIFDFVVILGAVIAGVVILTVALLLAAPPV
jgi:hypothetical protein